MNVLLLTLVLGMFCITSVQADPFLIVPGRSIGQTQLGRNGDFYLYRLPKPTGEDASLNGNRYWVWQANTSMDTLCIHSFRNDILDPPRPGVTIAEIRITSRRFHTPDGISPGATLAQIRKRFPRGGISSQNGYFYLAGRSGIAFEFAQNPTPAARCIAVTVYLPGPTNMLATDVQVRDILRFGTHM